MLTLSLTSRTSNPLAGSYGGWLLPLPSSSRLCISSNSFNLPCPCAALRRRQLRSQRPHRRHLRLPTGVAELAAGVDGQAARWQPHHARRRYIPFMTSSFAKILDDQKKALPNNQKRGCLKSIRRAPWPTHLIQKANRPVP